MPADDASEATQRALGPANDCITTFAVLAMTRSLSVARADTGKMGHGSVGDADRFLLASVSRRLSMSSHDRHRLRTLLKFQKRSNICIACDYTLLQRVDRLHLPRQPSHFYDLSECQKL